MLLDVFGVYGYIYIGGRSRSVELRGAHKGGGAPGGRRASLPRGRLASFLTSTPSPLDTFVPKITLLKVSFRLDSV